MKRSAIGTVPGFFEHYILQVDDIELEQALELGLTLFDPDKLKQVGDRVYAENKWTIKEILQHVIDAERIFSYRALRFARNDQTPLSGFDEQEFARQSGPASRTIDDLLDEFQTVRRSTILMFRHFSDEMLVREGTSSGLAISVIGLGFTIAGHQKNHARVIEERYYPLIQ